MCEEAAGVGEGKCLKKTEVANLQGDLGADVKIEAAFSSF